MTDFVRQFDINFFVVNICILQLHAKYTRATTGKHSRNLIVTSGVVASVLVSPILAGIAVGKLGLVAQCYWITNITNLTTKECAIISE